jgi:hypothetical protein
MKSWKFTPVAIALALAFPAVMAQSNAELLKELQNLQQRMTELEARLKAAESKPAAAPAGAQWGMTPEQLADFNRVMVKTEAIEDNLEAWGMKGLTVSGYIEPAFTYNKRQNRAGFQFLNDQADGYNYDTSYIGAATIDFTKETESGTRWKLTLTPQRGVGAAMGAGIVQEATVSIPITDLQTRLLVGQIPDWSGYEYQQPTLNPFTTHNLLYDFTLPYGYTGAGWDITRGKWWMRGVIGNVNATKKEAGDKSPIIAYRVDYSKGEFDGFGFAGMHGKATNYNTGTNTTTHMFEVDGYYTRGDWTFQGQVSVGQQKDAAITAIDNGDGTLSFQDAKWWGLSALAGYSITPRLQALVRADYLRNDKNGGGTFTWNGYSVIDEDPTSPTFGALLPGNDGYNGLGPDLSGDLNRGANRYALTFGLKYLFNQQTTFKAEYRLDGADRAVFEDVKNGNFKKNNHLLGASVVVAF